MKISKIWLTLAIVSCLILTSPTFLALPASANQPPNIPSTPSGPTSGCVNEDYTYSVSGTDPDGDSISFYIDMGDGSTLSTVRIDSGGSLSFSYHWRQEGTYYVKAQAMDSHYALSDWSSPLQVVIGSDVVQSEQSQLKAPWLGRKRITQGNNGSVSHYDHGTWDNTYAIDVALSTGSYVLAPADGIVEYVDNNPGGSGGKEIAIQHTGPTGKKFVTVYLHLSEICVEVGDAIRQGQIIAKSGATGDVTGPHLHFHIWSGAGSRDSHTIPIERLYMKPDGGDFRGYDARVGELDDSQIADRWFESDNLAIWTAGPTRQVVSATNTGAVSFSSSLGTITNLAAIAEETLPTVGKPPGVSFPHGLFSFNITGIPLGSTVTVTITFPPNSPPGMQLENYQTQYWKYQDGKDWYQIPIVSRVGNIMAIQLTDGGLGDADGVANGTIVDPGGPAVPGGYGGTRKAAEGASTGSLPVRLAPPGLKPRQVSVSSGVARVNQPVTVTAEIVNEGETAGNTNVALVINGFTEQVQTLRLEPGAARTVTFTVQKDQPGKYEISVGDQRDSFLVVNTEKKERGTNDGMVLGLGTLFAVVVLGLFVIAFRRRS